MEDTLGGYQRISKWTEDDWQRVEVRRADGKIDRLLICEAKESLLPVMGSQMHLTTPKLGLNFDSTLDEHGLPEVSGPRGSASSPVISSSRLFITRGGLYGQVTSEGFIIFDCEVNGVIHDARPLKLMLPNPVLEELDQLLSLSPKGRLALIEDSLVILRDVFKPSVHLNHRGKFEPRCLKWVSDNHLVIFGARSFAIIHVTDAFAQEIAEGELPCTGQLIDAQLFSDSFVCLMSGIDENTMFLLKYTLCQRINTSDKTSLLGIYESEGQLMHLRISSQLFGSSAHLDEATVINIREQSFLWEMIDVPFDLYLRGSLNGPISKVLVDAKGEWIAVAGRSGFCLCHLSQRHWILFADPREEEDVMVEHFAWVSTRDSQSKLLVVCSLANSIQKRQLWIVSTEKNLRISELAFVQEVERDILLIDACGTNRFIILTSDYIIQVVEMEFVGSGGRLQLSIVISASLTSFALSADVPCSWSISFQQFGTEPVNNFVIQRNDLLLTVNVPHQKENERSNSVASILKPTGVDSFIIWSPANIPILVIVSGKRLICHAWPFSKEASFELDLPSTPSAFYPQIAGGLVILLVQNTFRGSNGQDVYRVGINETISLLPALLYYFLGKCEDYEFTKLAKRLTVDNIENEAELILLIDFFLIEIYKKGSLDSQLSKFGKAGRILDSVLGRKIYRQCIAGFLRRIELDDASKLLPVLGPFETMFNDALNVRNIESAWDFLRVHLLGGDPNRVKHADTSRHIADTLKMAFEERNIGIFSVMLKILGPLHWKPSRALVDTISQLSSACRCWDFVQVLNREELNVQIVVPPASVEDMVAPLLLTSHYSPMELMRLVDEKVNESNMWSPTTTMLLDVGAAKEAALWSFFRDANPLLIKNDDTLLVQVRKILSGLEL